jgi:hypothetical protein
MPADRGPAADEVLFVEEILAEALGALTQHMSQCNTAWHQGSAALRSGDVRQQNLAIDQLILLREEWTPPEERR